MRKLFTSLFVFLLICGIAAADFSVPEQKIEIVGGEPVPLGELAILKPSDIKERPSNLVAVEYKWSIYELGQFDATEKVRTRVVDGEIWFGAGVKSKRVLAQCAATYLFLDKNGEQIKSVHVETRLISKIVQLGQPMPTVTGKANCAAIPENGSCYVEFMLSNLAEKDVVINLQTAGDAVVGKDYKLSSNSVVIPRGQLTGRVDIVGIDDNIHEPTQTINISVASVQNAEAGAMSFTFQLLDDDPDVPPAPPNLPDGQFKLAQTTYNIVVAKVKGNPKSGARALSQSFRNMASSISAGAFQDVESMLKATTKANNSALGSEVQAWDAFAVSLQDRLYELYQSRELKTLDDYAVAWLEIANGLEVFVK